jgi:hypothetical protein
MQLSGEYGLDELVRTLQGNFSCQKVTKNSKGKTLPLEEQKIVMELFFLHVELFPVKGIIEIYSISDDEKGVKKLNKLMTLTAK